MRSSAEVHGGKYAMQLTNVIPGVAYQVAQRIVNVRAGDPHLVTAWVNIPVLTARRSRASAPPTGRDAPPE